MLRRFFALGLLVAAACASPTLPLPPPELPALTAGADADHVKLTALAGSAEGDAIIVIYNTNPAVPGDVAVSGSHADQYGAWDATVYAHTGDVLEITQESGTLRSLPTILSVGRH